ncbi:hypothetical protein, unknown function [Leishmania mexicana MHOM/GT/2001/U1103]|uniref:Sulfite exporter TauE/SafE n=1 Tax=Leishmania mexicana (strain MHOM/GT/2001/U1103) TaxID=929439 RepID=E9B3Z2_LEIMU|nr:hypothetical protein, unknown function [Leishmania mexicana MHOM/GT/2001/U1103]CBZ29959.1 hypothetical protein, unknown function [Leishmania mexicana MHOM/GT/2001/U1103]
MTTGQTTTLLVYVTLAAFNFASSIIQGVAGIGDAILIQVLWLLASNLSDDFNRTPLGDSPVRAVALIMYIRLLFMSPLVVYLGIDDSVFSKQMAIMMAVPSTILTVVGVILYTRLDTSTLKKILGFTCFLFTLVYIGIMIYRAWRKKRQVEELKSRNVKLMVEANALEEEAQLSLKTSMVNLHASFVHNVPNNSIFAMRPPPPGGHGGLGVRTLYMTPAPDSSMLHGSTVAMQGSTIIAQSVTAGEIDARTGLPADTTEAFLSTIGGEVFVGPETQVPRVNEENVPKLTPSKISPSRTMTFTRVRINRNIDANGKIKMSTKISAAVAASLAGIMASLTGVNAPPQIIFILLFDAPNYIVRVNFSAQSIPGNVVRFIMAVWNGSFTWAMIPLMIDVVIFGFAGVFVGNRIGRLLGPQSFNVFVLCLLLLCSLAMVGKWQNLLIICTILTGIITVACGYFENKRNKPIIEKQRVSELEVEKRLYDCMEELQRSSNGFVQPRGSVSTFTTLVPFQRTNRPKPMWGGANFDNDDEGAGDEREQDATASSPAGATHGELGSVKGEKSSSSGHPPRRHSNATPSAAASVANETEEVSPAAPAAPHPGSAAHLRTIPTVKRSPGYHIPSSNNSDKDDHNLPSSSSTMLHNDQSVSSEVNRCLPERQSPSLGSMNSNV